MWRNEIFLVCFYTRIFKHMPFQENCSVGSKLIVQIQFGPKHIHFANSVLTFRAKFSMQSFRSILAENRWRGSSIVADRLTWHTTTSVIFAQRFSTRPGSGCSNRSKQRNTFNTLTFCKGTLKWLNSLYGLRGSAAEPPFIRKKDELDLHRREAYLAPSHPFPTKFVKIGDKKRIDVFPKIHPMHWFSICVLKVTNPTLQTGQSSS